MANNKHPAINKDSLKKIEKINDLLGGKGEDAFRLLDMYQSIDTVNSDQEASKTKKIVADYRAHLANKIEEKGFIISSEDNSIVNLNKGEITPKQQKLLNRYEAISALDERIHNKGILDESDKSEAKQALAICLKNKPEWSEKPFLQKLTDVLSVGIKPLYKAFFSKETRLKEELDQVISGPKR